MAALIKRGLLNSNQNTGPGPVVSLFLAQHRFYRPQNLAKRNKVKPKKIQKFPVPETRKLKSVEDSLASRGFLRCTLDYTPPEDVETTLESLYATVVGTPPTDDSASIRPEQKFALLDSCYEAFNHTVPNSILHEVNSFGDLKRFYTTPVDTTLPLDKFKTIELPPNLHIQHEPVRFIPETDKMFNGQTAFPKSSTIVSGLRTKRKYEGHKEPKFWPYDDY